MHGRACRLVVLIATSTLSLSVTPAPSAPATAAPSVAEPITVVLLPPNVQVFKQDLMGVEPADDWSAVALDAMTRTVRQALDRSTHFRVVELPALTSAEQLQVEEFNRVASLVSFQLSTQVDWVGKSRLPANFDRTLGPTLSFLRERTGADYAFGTTGFQLEQSRASAATAAGMDIASIAFSGWPSMLPMTGSRTLLYVVDLQSGELTWFNGETGHEVYGYNFTDLRDIDSTRKVISKLLQSYPDLPSLKSTAASPVTTTSGEPRRLSKPTHGGFALRLPIQWHSNQDATTVSATRDGKALNQISVVLRPHSAAFPRTAQATTRTSAIEQLAQWYVAELAAAGLNDLQILETATDAQLTERPAFRVRFSYRLPLTMGGARVEHETVGTVVPRGLLLAQLRAPQLHYFATALPDFEVVIRSVVLKPPRNIS